MIIPSYRRRRRSRPACVDHKPRTLRVEPLEQRCMLSAGPSNMLTVLPAAMPGIAPAAGDVQRVIVAGDPSGSPADSPTFRIDPNNTDSPFGGVGSLFMDFGSGSGFLCTGTLISPTHVLTAGHCVDSNGDGDADFLPGNVSFILNYGSDFSTILTASALFTHPDNTGFANPSVLDDLAIVELSSAVPAEVPIYAISTADFVNIETVTMVGYGTTGDGVNGYISGSASFTTKRSGKNHADVFLSDDEGSGAREGFQWDFDGDHKKTNVYGAPNGFNTTLGNNIETTVGGGDSGGPSFIEVDGNLVVFGVNTYTGGFGGKAPAPYFGSIGGGMVVSAYQGWINSIIDPGDPGDPGVNQAPTADAGADQGVTTNSLVQLDGSGSSDPESDLLTYSWFLSSVPLGSSAVLSEASAENPTFYADLDGDYVVTLVVNDGTSDSAVDSVTITATPATPEGSSMHVGDIDGSAQIKGKSGKWSANITVAIDDNNHNPVANATVSVDWSSNTGASGTVSGVTGADGIVSFSTGNLTSGTSVTFEVTSVTGSLDYNAAGNHDPDSDSNGTTIIVQKGGAAGAPVRSILVRAPAFNMPTVTLTPAVDSTSDDAPPTRATARRAERATFSRAAVDVSMEAMAESRSALRHRTASRRAAAELPGELEELISAIS